MFKLLKREYEESEDEVVKEMWEEIFCSENTFFEWMIAELDRSDEGITCRENQVSLNNKEEKSS